MTPVDLKKDPKILYGPSTSVVSIVMVPPMNYLMVDGSGDPNTSAEYREALEALYAVSYGLKFTIKAVDSANDYHVLPLEGLWWTDDVTAAGLWEHKEAWCWTAMIAQPEAVTPELVAAVIAEAGKKKELPALGKLRLERFDEGLCVQIMHIGPYSVERPTIEKLHAFAQAQGYKLRGRHHEIYLGDPRRSAPEKLRTIIRQPVE